jgi:hypothetical protein
MNQKRLMIGFLLVILLLIIMVYTSLEQNNNNPDIYYILENVETYKNTTVTFSGEITTINTSTQTVTLNLIEPPSLTLEVRINTTENLHQRDIVEILGILDGNNHVTAEKILISERWKYDLIYLRSLPAIPFALYLFFRTWHFNWKTYRFERRNKQDA